MNVEYKSPQLLIDYVTQQIVSTKIVPNALSALYDLKLNVKHSRFHGIKNANLIKL